MCGMRARILLGWQAAYLMGVLMIRLVILDSQGRNRLVMMGNLAHPLALFFAGVLLGVALGLLL